MPRVELVAVTEMLEEDNSRVPVPFSDLRNSGIEAELEPFMGTTTESIEDDSLSTDPGRVATDFDAAMTTSGDYGYTPHQHYRGMGMGRSIPGSRIAYSTTYQPSHVKSPLQQSALPEELSSDLHSSDEEDEITEAKTTEEEALIAKYVATRNSRSPTHIRSRPTSGGGGGEAAVASASAPPERQTVSPFGPYTPQPPPPTEEDPALVPRSVITPPPQLENRLSLTDRTHNMSVTPRVSREVAPPIEAERIRKLVDSIHVALEWARTLTEVSPYNVLVVAIP